MQSGDASMTGLASIYNSMNRCDPVHFIQVSELTEQFYEKAERLSIATQNFWRII